MVERLLVTSCLPGSKHLIEGGNMLRRTLMTLSLALVSAVSAADKKITIGLVAKSQSNPVFQAAYSGAKDAAKELGPKYNVDVVIDWQTPPDEDAQKQAQAI